MPWEDSVEASTLDTIYLYNCSGGKLISPLVRKLASQHLDGYLSESDLTTLSSIINSLNYDSWASLWTTENLEYNPLENYNMVEELDDTTEHTKGTTNTETQRVSNSKTSTETNEYDTLVTRTDNLTHGKTGTEGTQGQRTDNLTHGKTGTEGKQFW